MQILAIQVRTL